MEKDHAVLVVDVHLDSITNDQLLEVLKDAVIERIAEAENAVLFDCQRLTGRVTSQFLAALVSIRRRAAAQGVLICLCNVKGPLREAYEVTCLDRIIPVYEHRAAALAAVGNLTRRERAERTIQRNKEEEEREANMTQMDRFREFVASLREGPPELTGRTRAAAIFVGCLVAAGIIFGILYPFYVNTGLPRPRGAVAPSVTNVDGLWVGGEVLTKDGQPDADATIVAWISNDAPTENIEAVAVARYLNAGSDAKPIAADVFAARALSNGKFRLQLGPAGTYYILTISGTVERSGPIDANDLKKIETRLGEPAKLIGKQAYSLKQEEVVAEDAEIRLKTGG